MRDLLALALVGFGIYWFWSKAEAQEQALEKAVPTRRDLVRERLAEAGMERGTKIRNGGRRMI